MALSLGKRTAPWMICLLLCLSYLSFDITVPPNRVDLGRGWDARVTCAASRAYLAGRDPYYAANLADQGDSDQLPYIYPPIFLDLFAPACVGTHPLDRELIVVYPLLGVIMVLLLIDWEAGWKARILPTAAMVFGGFAGFYWVLKTGNSAFFIALFLSLAVFCFQRHAQNTRSRKTWDLVGAVNRRPNLTPYRRPTLTPCFMVVSGCPGSP